MADSSMIISSAYVFYCIKNGLNSYVILVWAIMKATINLPYLNNSLKNETVNSVDKPVFYEKHCISHQVFVQIVQIV